LPEIEGLGKHCRHVGCGPSGAPLRVRYRARMNWPSRFMPASLWISHGP
jgi:hypothetical protein